MLHGLPKSLRLFEVYCYMNNCQRLWLFKFCMVYHRYVSYKKLKLLSVNYLIKNKNEKIKIFYFVELIERTSDNADTLPVTPGRGSKINTPYGIAAVSENSPGVYIFGTILVRYSNQQGSRGRFDMKLRFPFSFPQ